MNISIQDSLQQLKEAVEELEALRTVIAMAEDHPVYSWIFGKSLKLSAKNSKLNK